MEDTIAQILESISSSQGKLVARAMDHFAINMESILPAKVTKNTLEFRYSKKNVDVCYAFPLGIIQ
jgi:hypothetical protein